MISLTRRPTVTCLLGLAALAFAGPAVRGQTYPRSGMSQPQRTNPAAVSRPYMPTGINGVNPYAGLGNYGGAAPYGGPMANQYASPYAAGSFAGNPYGSGYGQTPYSSGYGMNYEDPYGAYLKGAGQVIDSQGRFLLAQQQAYLLREQARGERAATRRKGVEEYSYERTKTPSAEGSRQQEPLEQVNRSLNNPPVTEIWSGKALNDILADIRRRNSKGETATLPTIALPLDENGLKRINVNRGVGNIGLLKNRGRLAWPLALSRPDYKEERELLTLRAQGAVQQAEFNSRVDPLTIRQMTEDVDKLRLRLRRDVKELSPSEYVAAQAFLKDLDAAITALQQADVGHHFTGKYTLRATAVAELVKQMTEQGLQFAPAVAGDESAYLALHRRLAEYDLAAQLQTAGR